MRDASGARIGDYLIDVEVPARSTEVAFRATHRVLPRSARVAILNPAFIGVRPAELQLMREACILEALHHSGVPRVFECGVLERRPWTATEYIDGVSLEQAAAERPLPISDATAIVRDAAAVLAHAHQRGVVHRNLTPRSILRTPGRGFPICVTDWGHASINGSTSSQAIEAQARFYRAPELALDGRSEGLPDSGSGSPLASATDGRADVFSLGVVMFEAATLVLPEPVQKFPGVPDAFHQLLANMLARFPEDRPTAAAVHAEATRLAEVFSEAEGTIEEVEVELVDISRSAMSMPSLGWMPPDPMVSLSGSPALGTLRRRREP